MIRFDRRSCVTCESTLTCVELVDVIVPCPCRFSVPEAVALVFNSQFFCYLCPLVCCRPAPPAPSFVYVPSTPSVLPLPDLCGYPTHCGIHFMCPFGIFHSPFPLDLCFMSLCKGDACP
eukprot:6213828-Pleurochrysis_carterae.AAC.3